MDRVKLVRLEKWIYANCDPPIFEPTGSLFRPSLKKDGRGGRRCRRPPHRRLRHAATGRAAAPRIR